MIKEYELPRGWVSAQLGSFTDVLGGSTPPRNESSYFGGSIIWLTPTEVPKETVSVIVDSKEKLTESGFKNSGVRWIPPGSVLLTSRASIGYVAIAGTQLTTNQGFASFVLPKSIEPKYLGWWLRSQKAALEDLAKGTTFKEISKATLKNISIPIAPFAEQQRIVAVIDLQFTRLSAGIAALRQAQTLLKRYRAAILEAAVEGKLSETWREEHPTNNSASLLVERILKERRALSETDWRAKGKDLANMKYADPAKPNLDNLLELPEGWCWTTVDQLAAAETNAITDGPFGSNLKTEHYTNAGKRVIRLQNIGNGIFNDEKAYISSEHFEKLSKHQIFAGDLVIATLGDKPPRCCIIPEFVGPAIVKADCIRFKVSKHVLNKYINLALNAEPTRKRTSSLIHGVGRPRLNLTEIKSITLPLPPIEEQYHIVFVVEQRFSVIDELERDVDASLRLAEKLRQSILRNAFTGRLVPQNSNDEPASILLERIRNERENLEQDRQQLEMVMPSSVTKEIEAVIVPKQRLSLVFVLRNMQKPVTPDELFRRGGFQIDEIDDFYEELRKGVADEQIEVLRPDDTQVLLKAASSLYLWKL